MKSSIRSIFHEQHPIFDSLIVILSLVLSAAAQSEPQLIAHWSFESSSDNTTFNDITGNGYDATCTKQLSIQPGVKGNALESTVSDYSFYIANSLNNFNAPRFSIAAWVYSYVIPGTNNAVHNDQIILSNQSYAGSSKAGYEIEVNGDGTIRFIMATNGSWIDCAGKTVLPARQWHHVVGTYDGDSMKIYIDGFLDARLYQPNGYEACVQDANIGCQIDASGGTSRNWFNGKMDELLFYTDALDAQAVVELYGSYDIPAPPVPELIAHWSFDSSSGDTTFYDVTGNGYDATCTNQLSTQPGVKGKALESTVSGYLFKINNSLNNFTVPRFTIAALVYTNVVPNSNTSQHNDQIILSYQSYPNATKGYELEINGDGTVHFIMSPINSDWINFGGKTVLPPRQWHHVVGTYDGDSMKIYVNGKLDKSLHQPNGYEVPNQNANIGCQSGDSEDTARNWFNGRIDELLFYNYALDAQAVAVLSGSYDIPAPPAPQLIAHWSFDSTDGETSYYDVTGNGFTAMATAVSVADGIKGQALDCSDTTIGVSIPNSVGNFNFENFTVEGLIYSYDNPVSGSSSWENYKVIFDNYRIGPSNSGITGGYCLEISDRGRLVMGMSNPTQGSWQTCEADGILLEKTWYHVAATYDSAYMRLFINGVQVKQMAAANGYLDQSLIPARIGSQFQVSDTVAKTGRVRNRLNGKIDELKLYNYAVGADTIAAHFASYDIPEPQEPEPELIAHWSFDANDGISSYTDVTDNGYNTMGTPVSLTTGVASKALDCKDSAFSITVPNSSGAFYLEKLTIEAWIYSYIDLVNPGSFYNYKSIFEFTRCGMEGSGVTGGYAMKISDRGLPHASFSMPNGGSWQICEGSEVLLPHKWYHMATTYDGNTIRLYVNGAVVKQLAAPNGYLAQPIPARIGAQYQVTDPATNAGRYRNRFSGKIDELKLYNYALDAQTLKTNYEALKPPDEPQFEINLGMKTTYARQGDTVVMPVYIANHEDYSFSALQLAMNYDPAQLTLLSISKDSGLVKDWELFDWNGATPGSIPLAMAGVETKLAYGEGELFRCTFAVSGGVDNNDTCVIGLDEVVIDETNNLIVSTVQNGRIIISKDAILYGDVTGNEEVNVVDAQYVLKYVVGALPLPDEVCCPNFTVAVADVSGNGTITSYDAALIFQYSIGLIGSFPVETGPARPLAKRTAVVEEKAALSFKLVNSSESELVYDLVGSNLCGFYAGEFAIECKAASDLISRSTITTTIRGATLMSKISSKDNLLKVAVSSNDDIDDDNPVTIVRIVLPPSQQAVPEFTIKTALINEGAIATEYDGGLVGLLSPAFEQVPVRASVRVVNNLLTVRSAGSGPAVLTVWNLNGRKIVRHVISGQYTELDISRYGRGAYLFRLQEGGKVTSGRFMLINR